MARNEEKHAGRLNRLWLQRLDEENAEKNPPRPGLGSLHTAEQVKKWMPSIKKDIDFYLKQSQVGCYPDRKIAEFSEKIEGLTKEYKAYLRKYRDLEGDRDSTPWSDQPYSRKHKITKDPDINRKDLIEPPEKLARNSQTTEKSEKSAFVPISLPVLENDNCNSDIYTYNIVNTEVPAVSDQDTDDNNQPLEFKWNKNMKALEYHSVVEKDFLDSQIQDEPLNFWWKKNDLSGHSGSSDKCSACSDKCSVCSDKCSECFDKCSSGCLKHSSEGSDSLSTCHKNLYEFHPKICTCKCSENLSTCGKNLCRGTNYDGCKETINDNGTLLTKSRETCAERIDDLNSCRTHTGKRGKDTTANNDGVNVLNLPYSDSSGEEDS